VTVYNTRVMNSAHIANVAPLAIRTALAWRGVAHICFPTDLQELDADAGPRAATDVPGHTSDVYSRRAALPAESTRQSSHFLLHPIPTPLKTWLRLPRMGHLLFSNCSCAALSI